MPSWGWGIMELTSSVHNMFSVNYLDGPLRNTLLESSGKQ